MSMLLACQFCDRFGVQYTYYVNEKRKHGFDLNPAVLKGYLVIAVDFDISAEVMKTLVDNDIVVVSFDHHDIQDEFLYIKSESTGAEGVVINNQYPFEPEEKQYLSGAGVAYESFTEMYEDYKSAEREAIVGITLLSDARPIENKGARYYLRKAYHADVSEGYLAYLISSVLDVDYGFGIPRLDRDFIDFNLSPRINSLLRFGCETEAVDFILGNGLRNKTTKKKQSDLVAAMKARASFLELQNVTIVAVSADAFSDFPNVDITSFIGLLCSDVKGTGKSVLGFVYDNGEITRASFRGQYDDIHYRTGFQNLGLDAQGHKGAFGINHFEPKEDTWVQIDELIGQLNEGHTLSATILESSNLSFMLMQRGLQIATDNCYVRDMYRTYIRYKGKNAKILRTTYKTTPFTPEDFAQGIKPDETIKGEHYKYIRDKNGNPVPKYIEYLIDGKMVKSFGVLAEEGLILPILEKGHVNLYIRENIE